MAVSLRLKRIGKTHRPFYRICATDSQRGSTGRYIESFGTYDPFVADDSQKFKINRERASYWLSVGAQPSATVRSFLRQMQVEGAGGETTEDIVKTKARVKARKKRSEATRQQATGGKKKKVSKKTIERAKKKGAKTAERKKLRMKIKEKAEAQAAAEAKAAAEKAAAEAKAIAEKAAEASGSE